MILVYSVLILAIIGFLIYFVIRSNNTFDVRLENSTSNLVVADVVSEFGTKDAFGRERVAMPFTLGDYTHIYGNNIDFFNITSPGASVTAVENQAAVRLYIDGATSGMSAIHQTKTYHHYLPGKSQLILASFVYGDPIENVIKRTGYFDKENGIYLEQDGEGTLSFVIRSYVSGSVQENKVSRNNWNGDKVDGSGESGYNLDITKTQLLFIDFQWLGVGTVRCGFLNKGKMILCNTFSNNNNLNTVYMSSANLPVRCEITNTSISSPAKFEQICSTVMSEGGYTERGRDWGFISPTLRTISGGSSLPVMAIRLKEDFKGYDNRMTVRLGDLNIISTTENIKYEVKKLTTGSLLSGGTWIDYTDESGIQYNVTATGISASLPQNEYVFELENGFVTGSGKGQNTNPGTGNNPPITAKQNYIVQNYYSNNSEIYVVQCTNLDSSDSTETGVGIRWREIY